MIFKDLKEKSLKDRQDEDYIRYQLEQLEEAKLIEGEQEQLEQEQDMFIVMMKIE